MISAPRLDSNSGSLVNLSNYEPSMLITVNTPTAVDLETGDCYTSFPRSGGTKETVLMYCYARFVKLAPLTESQLAVNFDLVRVKTERHRQGH